MLLLCYYLVTLWSSSSFTPYARLTQLLTSSPPIIIVSSVVERSDGTELSVTRDDDGVKE